jgi:hypothetical protein
MTNLRKSLRVSLLATSALLASSTGPLHAQTSATPAVFGYTDFSAEPKSKRNSSPSPTPNSPASTSKPSPPSHTSPPRLKTTRPPNTLPRNSAPPASRQKSFPTACS